MNAETREDLYWTLDTLVINIKEQLELLEEDMKAGATAEEFMDRIEKVRWQLIPQFNQDIEEIIADSGRE